ncbi:hypothetical protein BH09BAC3_BH09BAC3_27080 [soil metagenome]
MKLLDTIIISLSVVFIIISAYEVMTVGLTEAYTWLMITMLLMFWFTYRKIFNKGSN